MKRNLDTKRSRFAVLLICCVMATSLAEPLLAETPYLTGQLLVATPEMGDPRFVESVIYIIEHNEKGAMGLVINRPLAKGSLSDLLRELGIESKNASGEIILHYGGPVEPERAFVLHTGDYKGKDTKAVGKGLAVTADVDIMQAIAQGKGPRQSLFCLGYAGWTAGQLETEMKTNAWFSIPAEEKLILEGDPGTKWERAMARRRVRT